MNNTKMSPDFPMSSSVEQIISPDLLSKTKPIIVAIVGADGAGKTTLTDKLNAHLEGTGLKTKVVVGSKPEEFLNQRTQASLEEKVANTPSFEVFGLIALMEWIAFRRVSNVMKEKVLVIDSEAFFKWLVMRIVKNEFEEAVELIDRTLTPEAIERLVLPDIIVFVAPGTPGENLEEQAQIINTRLETRDANGNLSPVDPQNYNQVRQRIEASEKVLEYIHSRFPQIPIFYYDSR